MLLPPVEEAPAPHPSDAVHLQALKDVCHLCELWPRSGNWGQFPHEINWASRNFRLCYGAPPLGDAHRLPSLELIDARLEFNAAHECFLLDLRFARLYDAEAIDARLAATRRLAHVYWTMRRVQSPNDAASWAGRRLALAELRGLLGEADYYAGRWGEWVPVP